MAIPPEILSSSLLPPNSSDAEQGLENALRMDVDLSVVGTLWSPSTCPAEILPFLAWGLAIAQWDSNWTEQEKRDAIADAIPFHRRKGTRGIVEEVLTRFNPLLEVVEWWEQNPRSTPHTFEVRAPANQIPASFLNAETVNAIIRDISAVKRLSQHFTFVQHLEAQAGSYLTGAAQVGSFNRNDYAARHDPGAIWSNYLQTEDGEPIETEDGRLMEEG